MDQIEFDIDGSISTYGINNRYVKGYLNQAGKNPVICHLCSPGGEFLIAVNIKDEFSKHGNVTVDISGYAASAATYITLGAKHTRMSDSSFYLIHKVMQWVDAWGSMNEDQIASLILDLEKIKDENEKMTLVAAKAYADKSGKAILDILKLMKEEKWLTADEAKEWGFVDEVYNTTSKQDMKRIASKLNMLGLPGLPAATLKTNTDPDKIASQILTGIKNLLPKSFFESHENPDNHEPINKTQMKKFSIINSVLKVESIESADGKGCYFNEAQLQAIENALSERDRRLTKSQEHETAYSNAITTLNGLHPDIASVEGFEDKVNKIREKLAAKPGTPPSGVKVTDTDTLVKDEVDWAVMNTLNHMKED